MSIVRRGPGSGSSARTLSLHEERGAEFRSGDRFWLAHVRLGIWMSVTVIATAVPYLLLTPERPNRPMLGVVLGLGALVTLAVAMLPWGRLVRSGRALPLMVTWSLGLVPLIVVLARLDGGSASPLGLLLVLPLVFASMAYPVWATAVTGTAMVAGQLVLVTSTAGWQVEDLVLETMVLVLAAVMGAIIARNHWHNVGRVEELAEQLGRIVDRDGLTGCLNHRAFRQRLDAEVARSQRAHRPIALLHMDLDNFKQVNDRFGHPVGDQVLAGVGEVLRSRSRDADAVGRVGGEEFAVLLPDTGLAVAEEIAERLRAAVGTFDTPVHTTMSFGVSALPQVADTADELVASADRALYAAKRSGRDRVLVAPDVREQMALRVRGGLDVGSVTRILSEPCAIEALFQPIVELRSGRVHGHEALSRVRGSNTATERWLEAAAQVGLRATLEAAMWDAALDAHADAAWADGVPLFLNVSPDSLLTDTLWRRRDRLPPGTVLELSERETMTESHQIATAVRRWRDAGLRLAIDDVGAGYANLRSVLELRPEFVKLDRALVCDIDIRDRHQAMVAALVTFVNETGTRLVAEGVERDAEVATLSDLGVTLAQGFVLARPGNPPPAVAGYAA